MTQIATSLWFATEAEEAARFYCATIPGAVMGDIIRLPPGGPGPAGSVLLVEFSIGGAPMLAMNGNPGEGFTNAVSLSALCADQPELDRVWDALLDGGQAQACGWLKDRYGVAWQLVPEALPRLMKAGDEAQRGRVMAALMQMVKIDAAALEAAFNAS
ncbi:VOC family protein [Roseomonas terrae]|jgi:predicted 3-demethylubiquinone-9 3-methyltransferase (glyoxalase superfamily)|uniref:VOC family protein n=1 Tax=Neoroseomonas terrae TaxID=424799 RepID=A0ABS5EBZ0_9PROT|nr:VOC family protein [Neoroseomonas terrae]MBR0648531.1 VOC family protein [Neoroseomonas terrae]